MLNSYLPGGSEVWIQKALDRGSHYTLEDVRQGVENGEMHILARKGAAIVLAIQEDSVRFCLILAFACADIRQWVYYIDGMYQWARDNGCVEMRIHGRKGWARMLNYDITGQEDGLFIMRKPL